MNILIYSCYHQKNIPVRLSESPRFVEISSGVDVITGWISICRSCFRQLCCFSPGVERREFSSSLSSSSLELMCSISLDWSEKQGELLFPELPEEAVSVLFFCLTVVSLSGCKF